MAVVKAVASGGVATFCCGAQIFTKSVDRSPLFFGKGLRGLV